MPLNALLIEALRDYDALAPGELTVEYPAGSGSRLSLWPRPPTTSPAG